MSELKLSMRNIVSYVFFLFVFCGYGNIASAQDLLILKSGEEIKVNMVEEGTDMIKYRDFADPGGPLYSIGKDKVATIKYKKGRKNESKEQTGESTQVSPGQEELPVQSSGLQALESRKRIVLLNGQKLSVRKVKTLMEDYPDALKSYESGKTICTISNSCPFGIIVISPIVSGIANRQENEADKKAVSVKGLAVMGTLFISGIVLAGVGKSKIRKSVKLYNSAISKPVSYRLDFGVQQNGMGLALRF
jgi:hypothetical protein